MIRVAFISPTELISDYGNKGDIHLALSHLIDPNKANKYEQQLLASGLPIYLDNGAFENGVAENIDSLIQKAGRLKANYVFIPDTLYDRTATEAMISIAHNKLSTTATSLAAVVQADNPVDFIDSYKLMVADDRVKLIGLSILSFAFYKKFECVIHGLRFGNNKTPHHRILYFCKLEPLFFYLHFIFFNFFLSSDMFFEILIAYSNWDLVTQHKHHHWRFLGTKSTVLPSPNHLSVTLCFLQLAHFIKTMLPKKLVR